MIYSPPILQPDWSEVASHGTTVVGLSASFHNILSYYRAHYPPEDFGIGCTLFTEVKRLSQKLLLESSSFGFVG